MRFAWAAAIALAAAAPAAAQVDQSKIDEAIRKGAEYLTRKYADGLSSKDWNATLELVMLTLSHANVKDDDPVFKKGLEDLLTCKLNHTYRVAFLAMALQRIDAVKYQERLAHCAQWLVDSQLPNGEWGYPDTIKSATEVPKSFEVAPPKIEKKSEATPGTVARIKIKRGVAKNLNLKTKGDISNTQIAILGLKACLDGGIDIPKETWQLALNYILKSQNKDGGWGYYFFGMTDSNSYGAMTCAGICTAAVCSFALGNKNVARLSAIAMGLNWLGTFFKPDQHGRGNKPPSEDLKRWHYYYLYSIERVGKIVGVEDIGRQKWYEVGSKYLFEKQKADGGWFSGVQWSNWPHAGDMETSDTCFAILFLTRSTPPLVETGDKEKK